MLNILRRVAKGTRLPETRAGERALLGTDAEGNGVRDDVDAWIAGVRPGLLRHERNQRMGGKAPSSHDWAAKLFNTHDRTPAYLTWDASTDGQPVSVSNRPCKDIGALTTP